jgi:hypothetical protein
VFGVLLSVQLLAGCGTTREKLATDQLLLSDAVDRAVAHIDFSPLANEKVYLDTRFIQFVDTGVVNMNYVISALRQQMVVAGCLLQDTANEADYVVEARIGTLGRDGHDINYGVPPSNALNAAASLVNGAPPLPALPEVSLARKTKDLAAAKVAVFAYHRESKRPVWQSGTSIAKSAAQGRWFLGAGPFQSGAIYDEGTHFAGTNEKGGAQLLPTDYVYRSASVWDPELRARFESGSHLKGTQVGALPQPNSKSRQ